MALVIRRVILALAGMAVALTAAGGAPALAATTHHSLPASRHREVAHMTSGYMFPGQELGPGQSVGSSTVTLVMQLDGNLVLYPNYAFEQGGQALWASGTRGDNTAIMQGDGNFVIYPSNQVGVGGSAEWATNTYGNNVLVVQDDGNVVIYPSCCIGDSPVSKWATGTNRY